MTAEEIFIKISKKMQIVSISEVFDNWQIRESLIQCVQQVES